MISRLFANILVLVFLSSCSWFAQQAKDHSISGSVFGTSYHIKIVASLNEQQLFELQKQIESRLQIIDAAMSLWRDDSEISLFNQSPANEWFQLSRDTYRVVELAQEISELTQGYFDITVSPLVKLWGFKSYDALQTVPSSYDIQESLDKVGYKKLRLDHVKQAILKVSPVSLDLAAIAKGYAVDVIADLLINQGYVNHLVEIGGEVKVSGKRVDGNKWRLAIEKPLLDGRMVDKIIAISDQAVATSGDYRNYFIDQDKLYSHSIDPHTGYPVADSLTSVTIISDTSARADALATAVMVMGLQKGLEFVNQHNINALLINREDQGFAYHTSGSFESYSRSSIK